MSLLDALLTGRVPASLVRWPRRKAPRKRDPDALQVFLDKKR